MVEALGVSVFGLVEEDGGALINGDGWTTLRGFSCMGLGVFLLTFLLEVDDFGVFMVDYENWKEDVLRVGEGITVW